MRTGGFTPPTPGIGMNVEVKDPDMKIILSRVCIVFTFKKDSLLLFKDLFFQVYSYEGKISFTSHIPGEHIICLYSNTTAWIGGTQLVTISCFVYLNYYLLFIYSNEYRGFIWIFKLVTRPLIMLK